MIVIDNVLLDQVAEQARKSSRLRMNHNFHHSANDPVQQMLNAIEPGSYLRPHRHPDVDEVFFLVRGKGSVLIFDETGQATETILLSAETGKYGIMIPAGVWHSIVSHEPGTTIFEVKPGPYVPLEAKNFAPWSPEIEDVEGIRLFFQRYKSCNPGAMSDFTTGAKQLSIHHNTASG